MNPLPYTGRTSQFWRVGHNRVRKSPTQVGSDEHKDEVRKEFSIEAQILKRLGRHARIVPYHRISDNGIELSEASHGNLQTFIDSRDTKLDTSLRRRLAEQAAEAISYIHEHGVVHSDLRPENFLVNDSGDRSADGSALLNLWLCDFGGSTCEVLGLDGEHMPDTPFFDPRVTPWESKPATDIFSLGSILYVIMTGNWPFRTSAPPSTSQEMDGYRDRVDELFRQGIFPDTSGLQAANVIEGCWTYRYNSAAEALNELSMGR